MECLVNAQRVRGSSQLEDLFGVERDELPIEKVVVVRYLWLLMVASFS